MQSDKKSRLYYEDLGFEHKKITDGSGKIKYYVVCIKCSTELKNTSVSRMKKHRGCCRGVKKVAKVNKYVEQPIIYPKTEHKLGRHLGKMYGKLGFKPGKIIANGVYRSIALCLVCNKNIMNTSEHRLASHRRICKSDEYPSPEKPTSVVPEEGYINEIEYIIDKCTEKNIAPDKQIITKPLIHKSLVTQENSFKKFCGILGFRCCRFKRKNGLMKNVTVCLVCNTHILPATRPTLLLHRKICRSKEYNKHLDWQSSNIESESSCKVEYENTKNNEDNIVRFAGNTHILKAESIEQSVAVETPKKGGRNCSKLYSQLGFKCNRLRYSSGILKNVATCLVCNLHLRNTAGARLVAHRRVCNSEEYNCLPTEPIIIETVDYDVDNENQTFNDNKVVKAVQCSGMNVGSVPTETLIKEERCGVELGHFGASITRGKSDLSLIPDLNLADDTSNMTDLQEAVANFIYGCSLPFRVTESVHFERLIRTLDSNCVKDIPRKQELSQNILTRTYIKYLEETKSHWHQNEAPLILDIVESKDGHKFYVSILQDGITGRCAFVNSSALGDNVDDEDSFNKIVTESVELAKILYNTDVYAIVTNRIVRNDNPENFTNVWYLPCHRYLASVILKDFLASVDLRTCLFKVKIIVDEIKTVDFFRSLTYRTYRRSEVDPDLDNLYFLVENWELLKQTAFANLEYNLSNDVKLSLCNSGFKNVCKNFKDKIDLLNEFIKKLIAQTYSLADSLTLWQRFVDEQMVRDSTDILRLIVLERVKETENVYSLVARYFGDCGNSDFSREKHKKIADFFRMVLSKEAFEEYIRFQNTEITSVSERDNYYNSANFWELMKKDLPSFAEFALQMLRIPGSSRLREIFKGFVKDCENVNKEQLRMLMGVYFSLNVREIEYNL